jgi:hypothetical protein
MTDATANATPPKAGIWEDFIDILREPSEVFERRRDGQFGLALVILVVISTILYFALRNGLGPITDAEISRQAAAMAEKNPQISAEQLSSMRGMMETFAMFGTIIFIPIGVLITGVLLWLAGKLLEAKIAFTAGMMIATYAQVPRILEIVISALQGLFLPPESITSRYSVTLGIGRFLSPDTNPVLLTLLGGIDLFTIWTLVLMAIGMAVVARVSLQRGAIAVVLVWIVGLLPGLYQAISQ